MEQGGEGELRDLRLDAWREMLQLWELNTHCIDGWRPLPEVLKL
jgi:hypothetical protein